MESAIKSIIEFDRKARERTEAALAGRQKAIEKLEQQKEEIREKELSFTEGAVEVARLSAESATKSTLEEIAENEKKSLERLTALYSENSERWVDMLVSRVTR